MNGGVVVTEAERQAIVDEEQLRLLPIAYWVLGGFDILIALYGLLYVGLGLVLGSVPLQSSSSNVSPPPPGFVTGIFVAIGLAIMVGFGVVATLKILTGFWIRKRKHRTACLVIAGVSCLSIPFGTIVGVLSFMVLLRPSVSALFGYPIAPQPPLAVQVIPEPPREPDERG